MSLPKRSSDNYIQFKRKITNKEILNIVLVLSRDRLLSEQEILYQFISDGAKREIEKRKRLSN